jgi:hypothetical protein
MALRPYGQPPARPASVLALNGSRQAQLRPITTIVAPSAAGPTTTPIPREFALQDLILIVTGTMTVTTAGAGALRAEQPLSVIRSLEILGSPVGTIKKGDAAGFFRLQHLLKGTPGLLTALGSVATADFEFHLDIDFELEGIEASRRDTLLRGKDYTSLDLIINWGDKNDIISGATTWALSALQAVLMCHEFRDGVSLNPPRPYKIHKVAQDESPCATATSSFSFPLTGKHTLRGILIKQFTRASGVTNDTPVSTIINNVTLELDGDPRAKWSPYSALRGDNKTFFSVETLPTGYAFLDLMRGSRENEINVNRYSTPKLIFDVNTVTDGYLKIYPVELI